MDSDAGTSSSQSSPLSTPSLAAPTPGRARKLAPILVWSVLGLIALGALIDWPKSEPAARRMLSLRAAELEDWLGQELLVPIDRIVFAEVGGELDAAGPWRAVARELESAAADGALPDFHDPAVRAMVRAAIGARRFAPFVTLQELVGADWLRAARIWATLIDRTPAGAVEIEPWLDAAVVYASDLRSMALLAPAVGACELEMAVERRLLADDSGRGRDALAALIFHSIAAAGSIPSPERIAERESRLAQALVCARARIPPFAPSENENDEWEPPWPLTLAAGVVDRLESYDERLCTALLPVPPESARAEYVAWIAALTRELPIASPLVADDRLLAPLRDTSQRLERIRAAAQRRLDAIEGGTEPPR